MWLSPVPWNGQQFSSLSKNPDLIIATPGRLMHLLVEIDDFHLNRVDVLVFDEADRLFEMGFAEQIKEIMSGMSATRQVRGDVMRLLMCVWCGPTLPVLGSQSLLFSATMPRQLMEFARAGLKEPEVVRLDSESTVSDKLQVRRRSCRVCRAAPPSCHYPCAQTTARLFHPPF